MTNLEKMKYLVDKLNECRDAYYNRNESPVSDEVYDQLFNELKYIENATGVILSNSPTNTVGFKPVSELPTVKHPVQLLSLDKVTSAEGVIKFKKDKKYFSCFFIFYVDKSRIFFIVFQIFPF